MKQVLKEVKNRYVVFNNKATGEVNDKQVVDLMNRIDDLKSTFSAEEQFFTDTKTEKAEQKIEEEVKKIMGAYNIGEKKAREMLMKQIENEEKNAFLKNVGKAVGIGILITAAVGMVVVSGGAGIVAIALAEGGAAGASAAAAAASASSAVGSLAAADKAKKMCVVM
nr:hypothetical protein BaRGS_003090 [Batillaria attramentaria]